MNTDNDAYYIKDEPAAKAEEVFWKYEIEGYNIPYRIELVSAEGKYCLRSVNSRTGTYYGACELPIEKLPEDIDECFKFTGLPRNDPGLIIFIQPDGGLYRAEFYELDLNGKLRKFDIVDGSGNVSGDIHISDDFTVDWTYMAGTYESSEGTVIMRLEKRADEIHIIDKVYNCENYRAIEGVDISTAIKDTDTAQMVYYNENGEAQVKLPTVNGRLYDVSNFFNSVKRELERCSYLDTEFDTSGSGYAVAEINAVGERYVFTIYDVGVLNFTYKDISESYRIDDADEFLESCFSVMLDYPDYIISNFMRQLEGIDHSTGALAALVDENCGLGAPSEWKIFKNLTVISDTKYVKISGDGTSCIYKLSFNVNSFDPAPFKNGGNVYEVVISENENGETKITSVTEV